MLHLQRALSLCARADRSQQDTLWFFRWSIKHLQVLPLPTDTAPKTDTICRLIVTLFQFSYRLGLQRNIRQENPCHIPKASTWSNEEQVIGFSYSMTTKDQVLQMPPWPRSTTANVLPAVLQFTLHHECRQRITTQGIWVAKDGPTPLTRVQDASADTSTALCEVRRP